ncbi:hypothetical protein B0H11DRAFT_920412 [Mycena galericulata]|nr:hypothetical protein B0H11DRAFT_920412 [Mycena galericulata]
MEPSKVESKPITASTNNAEWPLPKRKRGRPPRSDTLSHMGEDPSPRPRQPRYPPTHISTLDPYRIRPSDFLDLTAKRELTVVFDHWQHPVLRLPYSFINDNHGRLKTLPFPPQHPDSCTFLYYDVHSVSVRLSVRRNSASAQKGMDLLLPNGRSSGSSSEMVSRSRLSPPRKFVVKFVAKLLTKFLSKLRANAKSQKDPGIGISHSATVHDSRPLLLIATASNRTI